MSSQTIDPKAASVVSRRQRIERGGEAKYHEKNREQKKLFARERIALLLDEESFVEDGLFAHCSDEKLPADGVITGFGTIRGRRVALMANDSTVKAGSWGARTVEKILRLQENAARMELPLFYLVDSAGARITDQVAMFPGRRGAGRIFYHESGLSGKVPQICLLFGPSAAGGAYIPAFCRSIREAPLLPKARWRQSKSYPNPKRRKLSPFDFPERAS